jgi:hypothetical protein
MRPKIVAAYFETTNIQLPKKLKLELEDDPDTSDNNGDSDSMCSLNDTGD